jgi:SagB-type dehydrogenase family enzyme
MTMGRLAASIIAAIITLHGGLAMAQETISLPEARDSTVTLEASIRARHSVREFTSEPLALGDVGQILWAAQGIVKADGRRSVPSAGALYPIEVYLVVGAVEGLDAGVYRYVPQGHKLARVSSGDVRTQLTAAAIGQEAIAHAPATLVIGAELARSSGKYGERARRYVDMEAGHVSQNVYLQVVPLGLGTVAMGAFRDERVREICGMRRGEEPLYIMPFGKPK